MPEIGLDEEPISGQSRGDGDEKEPRITMRTAAISRAGDAGAADIRASPMRR